MKNKTICLILFALTMALAPGKVQGIDAGVATIVFATPEKPYLEINIEIAAESVTFKRIDSIHLQAGVETLILIKQGDKIVAYEKYRLSSPLVGGPQDLLDVKRMFVPEGEYEMEISFQDVHDASNTGAFTCPLTVSLSAGAHLSEILLLRSYRPDNSESPFTKNGYFLEPLPFRYYDRTSTMLAFYAEIYHSGKVVKGDSYLVRYLVEKDLGNGKLELISVGSQRKKPSAIDALLVPVGISKMKSGNYVLTVELRNEANELLASRQVSFQRSNPFLDVEASELAADVVDKQFVKDLNEENLRFSLRAISPQMYGDDAEVLKNILQGTDLKAMRYFLFRHFVTLDPNNPEQVYLEYMKVAGAADQRFKSGFRFGFETDRGRTFMRYGRPDDLIRIEDDPSAPPYEIWVYYDFPKTQQKNVKFLFYNPTLAGEDFIMLHSNARGEINNPRWERDLYKRNAGEEYSGDNYHDATSMQRNVGRNARVFFEDF